MNTKSLSFRLTAGMVALFLASTLLSFGGFYLVTKRLLFSHTDASLVAHGSKVVQVVAAQEVGMHDALAKEAFIKMGERGVITKDQGRTLAQKYDQKLKDHSEYIKENGVDPEEIEKWKWKNTSR